MNLLLAFRKALFSYRDGRISCSQTSRQKSKEANYNYFQFSISEDNFFKFLITTSLKYILL